MCAEISPRFEYLHCVPEKNRIKEIMDVRGLGPQDVADKCDPRTSRGQIYQLIKGERRLTTDWMQRLAKALDCEPADLISKTSPTLSDSAHQDDYQAAPGIRYEQIPVYDASASAGHGFLLDDHTAIVDQLTFKATWLRSRTQAKPEQMAVLKVQGDSMTPTLSDGDDVLVDRTQRSPAAGGIFVIAMEGVLLVKRLMMTQGKVKVISDNDVYPAYESESVEIVGRVIWHAGNL